jgi:hypothetical protein
MANSVSLLPQLPHLVPRPSRTQPGVFRTSATRCKSTTVSPSSSHEPRGIGYPTSPRMRRTWWSSEPAGNGQHHSAFAFRPLTRRSSASFLPHCMRPGRCGPTIDAHGVLAMLPKPRSCITTACTRRRPRLWRDRGCPPRSCAATAGDAGRYAAATAGEEGKEGSKGLG